MTVDTDETYDTEGSVDTEKVEIFIVENVDILGTGGNAQSD